MRALLCEVFLFLYWEDPVTRDFHGMVVFVTVMSVVTIHVLFGCPFKSSLVEFLVTIIGYLRTSP